jgi:hypothetical protein
MEKPWIIVQYDNRVIEKDLLTLIEINKKYCNQYGYEYILETKPYDLPPWWIKVKLVKDLLDTNQYKGALWLDTDAVIHNAAISLDSLLVKDKSFYYCSDAPVWSSIFCAGVWLIKNDAHGKEILTRWINSYSPNEWVKKDDKWTTLKEWGGPSYEQGAFIEYILPTFQSYTHQYPWQVFQSYEPHSSTFTMHFAGQLSDTYLPNYINRLAYNDALISILFYLFVFLCILSIIYMVFPKWFQPIRRILGNIRHFTH